MDYLAGADTANVPLILFTADLTPAIQQFWQEVRSRYTLHRGEKERPLVPPEELFLSEESFFAECRQAARLVLGDATQTNAVLENLPPISLDRRSEDPLAAFRTFLTQHAGRTIVIAETPDDGKVFSPSCRKGVSQSG